MITEKNNTPETDAAWNESCPLKKLSDTEKKEFARTLERERDEARDTVESLTTTAFDLLTALENARNERDEAREESDKWEQLAHDKLSEVCRQIDKTRAVTEQRDRLAEAHERILEYQGRFAEEDPESIAKEALQSLKVTEKRSSLADLVKQFISILDITEESDSGRLFHPTNITSCRAGDLQKIGELVEELRRASLHQPTES